MPSERQAIANLIVAGMNLREHWAEQKTYIEMDATNMAIRAAEMRRRDAETKREFLAALRQAERGQDIEHP